MDWMLQGVTPPKALGVCGSPGQRNLALAQKLRVNGTPAIFFRGPDMTRIECHTFQSQARQAVNGLSETD